MFGCKCCSHFQHPRWGEISPPQRAYQSRHSSSFFFKVSHWKCVKLYDVDVNMHADAGVVQPISQPPNNIIVSHYIILCHVVLYRIVLHCIVLYRVASYRIVLHCMVLYHIVSYCISPYRTVFHCIVKYHIVSYRIVFHVIVLYFIVSCRIVSYHIVSYCIVSDCIMNVAISSFFVFFPLHFLEV